MLITHSDWLKLYSDNNCHPEFIKSEFNRVKGSKTFPIYPTRSGMLELTDGDFINRCQDNYQYNFEW
jgi:hypothetical protein